MRATAAARHPGVHHDARPQGPAPTAGKAGAGKCRVAAGQCEIIQGRFDGKVLAPPGAFAAFCFGPEQQEQPGP